MASKSNIGKQGEKIAARYLKQHGYKILEKNWRSKRWGEIDIIATKDGYLVFVEVKTKTTKKFGNPQKAVTYYKLKKLKKAAQYYICTHQNIPKAYRIDVVGIYLKRDNGALPIINLYENAH